MLEVYTDGLVEVHPYEVHIWFVSPSPHPLHCWRVVFPVALLMQVSSRGKSSQDEEKLLGPILDERCSGCW